MMANYLKLSQMIASVATAMPDIVSLLKEINTASGSGTVAIELANKFFSNPISKENKKQLTFLWEGQEYISTALL